MATFDGVELNDVVLIGERLTLRPWRSEDRAAVFAALQSPEMHRFLMLPRPYGMDDAEDYVNRLAPAAATAGTGLTLAVAERASGRVVGSARLGLATSAHSTSADVGYWIAPSEQGQGRATESTRLLAAWAFDHGIGRVELRCTVTNLASARTALAAGFGFEAVLRRESRRPDGPADTAVFARLAADPGSRIAPRLPPLPADGIGPGRPGLSDGTLGLRVIAPEDAAALTDENDNPEARRWSFTGAPADPADDQRTAQRSGLDWLVGSTGRLAMVDLDSGQTAGLVTLRLTGPPRVGNIGYGVRPAFRGRGYTTRALRLLTNWAFGPAGLVRLELGAKSPNIASQRAAANAGFEPDGVRRARLVNPDGTVSDEVRFALVNPAVRQ